MDFPDIHRVVTGHDAEGRSIVSQASPLATVLELSAIPGTRFHEVWNTAGCPAPIGDGPDPTLGKLMLPPPAKAPGSASWTFHPTPPSSWPAAPRK